MTQVTGAITVELSVGQIADTIASAVVERLHAAARQATTEGSDEYEREFVPGQGTGRPSSGPRHDDVAEETLRHDDKYDDRYLAGYADGLAGRQTIL